MFVKASICIAGGGACNRALLYHATKGKRLRLFSGGLQRLPGHPNAAATPPERYGGVHEALQPGGEDEVWQGRKGRGKEVVNEGGMKGRGVR